MTLRSCNYEHISKDSLNHHRVACIYHGAVYTKRHTHINIYEQLKYNIAEQHIAHKYDLLLAWQFI